MAVNPSAASPATAGPAHEQPGLTAVRRRLATTATVAVLGIAVSTIVDQTLGGWITVLGVVALLHALHRFGRTGPG